MGVQLIGVCVLIWKITVLPIWKIHLNNVFWIKLVRTRENWTVRRIFYVMAKTYKMIVIFWVCNLCLHSYFVLCLWSFCLFLQLYNCITCSLLFQSITEVEGRYLVHDGDLVELEAESFSQVQKVHAFVTTAYVIITVYVILTACVIKN